MPNFSYTRDIPFATHNPSSDQPIMQTNTNSDDSIWTVDHFGFNDNNGGLHKQVHLKNEAAPGLGGLDGVLYANLATGQSWPFWQNALASFQLAGPVSAANNGTVFLPGGIIIKFGSIAAPGSSGSLAFTTPFPSNVFSILFTIQRASTSNAIAYYVDNGTPPTVAGFNYTGTSSGSTNLFWLAIGN